MLWRTTLLLVVAVVQSSGCGPTESAARTREPRGATRPAVSEPSPSEAAASTPETRADVDAEVAFDETTCVLRAAAGAVRAECADGSLSCTEVARADLADLPGDEVLARCDDEDAGARALAVVNGDRLLWMRALDQVLVPGAWTCSFAPTSQITLVDVVPGPRRELFVRIRDCIGSGELGDSDELFAWHAGEMIAVAGAGLDCQYTGNTGDPDAPEPPAGESYVCEGGYLDVAGGAVTWIGAPERVTVSARRDEQGRVALGPSTTRVALRWNAEAFRFEGPR